jgi:hypothetical protein
MSSAADTTDYTQFNKAVRERQKLKARLLEDLVNDVLYAVRNGKTKSFLFLDTHAGAGEYDGEIEFASPSASLRALSRVLNRGHHGDCDCFRFVFSDPEFADQLHENIAKVIDQEFKDQDLQIHRTLNGAAKCTDRVQIYALSSKYPDILEIPALNELMAVDKPRVFLFADPQRNTHLPTGELHAFLKRHDPDRFHFVGLYHSQMGARVAGRSANNAAPAPSMQRSFNINGPEALEAALEIYNSDSKTQQAALEFCRQWPKSKMLCVEARNGNFLLRMHWVLAVCVKDSKTDYMAKVMHLVRWYATRIDERFTYTFEERLNDQEEANKEKNKLPAFNDMAMDHLFHQFNGQIVP